VDWIQAWLEKMDLNGITLVCQDWGGLIGLRLVTADPDRFARVVTANTGLPTGDYAPSEAFLNWRKFSIKTPNFDAGAIVAMATQTEAAVIFCKKTAARNSPKWWSILSMVHAECRFIIIRLLGIK
jgi:pimeloyl-ACP methyl ester carboxylesterase